MIAAIAQWRLSGKVAMYEKFFGLREAPFANIPDPRYLFMSAQHQRALAMLQYALVSRAGFCVITGNIGAGKTTLLRRMLQTLDGQFHFGLVSNSQCDSFDELLRWILLSFDLDYRAKSKVEMYDELVGLLVQRFSAGTPAVLVIDEAQNLGVSLLEQLRMLSNVNSEKGQLLQIVLVGQPELWDLLRDPQLEQLAQRISYEFFLGPLSDVDTVREYVEHRVQVAGGAPGLFAPEVFPLIAEASGGVPRLINRICDHALVYGYSDCASFITAELVVRVLSDMSPGRASSPMERPRPAVDGWSLNQRIEAVPIEAVPIEAPPVEALPIETRPTEVLPIEAPAYVPMAAEIPLLDQPVLEWPAVESAFVRPAIEQPAIEQPAIEQPAFIEQKAATAPPLAAPTIQRWRSRPSARRHGRLRRSYC